MSQGSSTAAKALDTPKSLVTKITAKPLLLPQARLASPTTADTRPLYQNSSSENRSLEVRENGPNIRFATPEPFRGELACTSSSASHGFATPLSLPRKRGSNNEQDSFSSDDASRTGNLAKRSRFEKRSFMDNGNNMEGSASDGHNASTNRGSMDAFANSDFTRARPFFRPPGSSTPIAEKQLQNQQNLEEARGRAPGSVPFSEMSEDVNTATPERQMGIGHVPSSVLGCSTSAVSQQGFRNTCESDEYRQSYPPAEFDNQRMSDDAIRPRYEDDMALKMSEYETEDARATNEDTHATNEDPYANWTADQIQNRLAELTTHMVKRLEIIRQSTEKHQEYRQQVLSELDAHKMKLDKRGHALVERRKQMQRHFLQAPGLKLQE
ncbi:hypothetical protein DFJ77DRAFT_480156 [Powellomyces hirtus]|nr:hypothetical protein DFJ77DRAFT_480156 [Powellomyces hirtus]